MAQKYLKEALEMAPNDPFVLHELGVIAFQSHRYVICLCSIYVYILYVYISIGTRLCIYIFNNYVNKLYGVYA